MNQLQCYTRVALESDIYDEKLAYSMHIALREGDKVIALNHNSGVLFARAIWNEDGSLCAKSLKNPWIFRQKDGTYGVLAIRTEAKGEDDLSSKGCIIYTATKDFIEYEEEVLLRISDGFVKDITCEYNQEDGKYRLAWIEEGGAYESLTPELDEKFIHRSKIEKAFSSEEQEVLSIEGAVSRNAIEIPDELTKRLRDKLLVPIHISTDFPKKIMVKSQRDLESIRATLTYSDGTTCKKRVDWYMEDKKFDVPGEYEIEGRIHQDHYEFPIAFNRADPCIGKWKDKYYFIATNDADNNHTLYIREADSVPALVTAQEVLILDSSTYSHVGNLLWAPEFHIINNRLYILHAATPGRFEDEQCHVMALKEGGNPMRKEDWEEPKRVIKMNGDYLYDKGITLDMTHFEVEGVHYVCWSQRQFDPIDLGAWLYIATINPNEPWKLTSDPILLSVPDYGWANNHTFVDEGPYTLIKDGVVYLTFSSAAVDSTYVVGLLRADVGNDLLEVSNWKKSNFPLLTSRSVEGQYGTGHNAYITDEEGDIWNTYHGRPGVKAPRSSGVRRVHFDVDGHPRLDLTEEKDLSPALTQIKLNYIIV